METLVEVSPSTKSWNLASGGTPVSMRSGRPPSTYSSAQSQRMKPMHDLKGSVAEKKSSVKAGHEDPHHEEVLSTAKNFYVSDKGRCKFVAPGEVKDKSVQTLPEEKILREITTAVTHPVSGSESSSSSSSADAESSLSDPSGGEGDMVKLANHVTSQSRQNHCPSPSNSVYTNTGTLYVEAKESFTNTELSEEASAVEKYGENGNNSNSYDVESRKTSIYRRSTDSDVSNESSSSSLSSAWYKPHKANDTRWEAIQSVRCREGAVEFKHFNPMVKLGCGDIGTVYLSELIGTETYFAMKFMNKEVLSARKKLLRAQTEREILQSLDHPFLPTLYTHFETEKVSCLVMEFCPGGDLHNMRQKQPGKHFPEHAARFYVAEVLLALEYLHMLGIIYRDLKPENVLVREDGHIMLSDFDLSLRCAVCPTLVKSGKLTLESKSSSQPACIEPTCMTQPDCIQPACFGPRFMQRKAKKEKKKKLKNEMNNAATPLPELLAEPTSARSMSFVGTHEYLAPEIIKGEGHGSAVDWWTFGIFLYELLFGKTPFKGAGNRATLFNVVGQPLRFPESPPVSFAARDLIRGLLVKEPEHRLAYRRGATEIKQHPFFQSINWALIRCTNPPQVPRQSMAEFVARAEQQRKPPAAGEAQGVDVKPAGNYYDIEFF